MRTVFCYLAKCTSISSWCVSFPGLKSLSAIFILNRRCSHWPFRILHIYKGAFYKNILKCHRSIISFILITSLWGERAHITLPHHHQTQHLNESTQKAQHRGFLEDQNRTQDGTTIGLLWRYMNIQTGKGLENIILSPQQNSTFLRTEEGGRGIEEMSSEMNLLCGGPPLPSVFFFFFFASPLPVVITIERLGEETWSKVVYEPMKCSSCYLFLKYLPNFYSVALSRA